ncbi:putative T7SS-secreted protein [Streptomyces sp. NPDC047000]|uniref:putative T7SS-secreted protein n=1 Tax=Streptomyces sp. NPDC047000 TaxID=3155474 RepID=UPI0033CC1649
MARRHSSRQDFELVGMDSDPTPGDPDLMQGLITRYRDVGDAAEKALNVLKRDGDISRGRGDAIDALNKKIGEDLPDKLRKTATSFHDAAQAYTDYAPRLREAQETFDKAVDQAGSAAGQANQAPIKLSDSPTDEEKSAATKRQDDIEAGQSALNAAKSLAQQARQMRESAQRQCEDVLDRAASEAIPERSIFQKIADFFKDFPFVKILLGILVAAVSVFFPVAGALLGGALFALDQISALASGNFNLGDFAVGLLSFVPGGNLLKGAGSAASKFIPNLTKSPGSIKNIKSTVDTTKTVAGPQSGGSLGNIVKQAGGDFAGSAAGETANQALSGDNLDLGAILGAGALGAVGGGIAGGGGRRNPPPIPTKNGSNPGNTTRSSQGGDGPGATPSTSTNTGPTTAPAPSGTNGNNSGNGRPRNFTTGPGAAGSDGGIGGRGGNIGVGNSDGSGLRIPTNNGDVINFDLGGGGAGSNGGKGGNGGNIVSEISGDGTTNITLRPGGAGSGPGGKGGNGGNIVSEISGDGTTNITTAPGGKGSEGGIGGDAGSTVVKINGNGPVNVTRHKVDPSSDDGSSDGKPSTVVIIKPLNSGRPSSTTGDGSSDL